jgi:LacI family transcriptional regulator
MPDAAQFRQWLERYRPEVVVSTDHHLVEEIRKAGWQVPQEIGFVCLGLWEAETAVSGVFSSNMKGRELVDVVDGEMQRNEYGMPAYPRIVLTPPNWNEGATLLPEYGGRRPSL